MLWEILDPPQQMVKAYSRVQWWIQDFPDGVGPTFYFPNFPWKVYENEEIWTERGRADLHPQIANEILDFTFEIDDRNF